MVNCSFCGNRVKKGIQLVPPYRNIYVCSYCGEYVCSNCIAERRAVRYVVVDGAPITFYPNLRMLKLWWNLIQGQPWTAYDICERCDGKLGVFKFVVDRLRTTGKHEELAQFYEKNGFLEEAGEARREATGVTVKEVRVDLNALIERIRQVGVAVPFKCPSCGAGLVVDKNSRTEGLRYCSYCGTAVDTNIVVDVIRAALK